MSELRRHPVPESVDTEGWTLTIGGCVDRSLEFDLDDLSSLPRQSVSDDFACVDGWSAAGLSWRGIPVSTLLDRAGPTVIDGYGLVHALDGDYACAFPLDRLREALLAVELDDEPLPVEHGGPARFVPGGDDSDCWEQVKWVSTIEITTSQPTDTAKAIALGRIDE